MWKKVSSSRLPRVSPQTHPMVGWWLALSWHVGSCPHLCRTGTRHFSYQLPASLTEKSFPILRIRKHGAQLGGRPQGPSRCTITESSGPSLLYLWSKKTPYHALPSRLPQKEDNIRQGLELVRRSSWTNSTRYDYNLLPTAHLLNMVIQGKGKNSNCTSRASG